jgi:hypothetical protein
VVAARVPEPLEFSETLRVGGRVAKAQRYEPQTVVRPEFE